MAWTNQPLVLYHGTNTHVFPSIPPRRQSFHFAVDWDYCRVGTDFSRGFYATTSPHQASQWANNSVRRLKKSAAHALVISFEVDREELASLSVLAFVRDSQDYYDLVSYCRSQRNGPRSALPSHGRGGTTKAYDVVFGPVSVGRQSLIIQGADQVSFHSEDAFACLCRSGATVFDVAATGSRYLP